MRRARRRREHLTGLVEQADQERTGTSDAPLGERWLAHLRHAYPHVPPDLPAHECSLGLTSAAERAAGARRVYLLDDEADGVPLGGEAHWRAGGALPSDGMPLGSDGYREGWEELYGQLVSMLDFDGEGWPVWWASRVRVQPHEVDALPPLLRLECHTRWKLGDVRIEHHASRVKLKVTHVNLEEQRQHHRALCLWQARWGITHGAATDAARAPRRDEKGYAILGPTGEAEMVNALAWIDHDGGGGSGQFDTAYGADNYLGELSALIRALEAAPPGGRLLVVTDAMSPVAALRSFTHKHDRHKLGYLAAELLDTLDQLVERQEAVVFLWQPSHVGAPVNEAADVAAGAALKVERWVQVPSYTPRFCSLLYSMATRTPFRWATRMMCRVVHRRLLDAVDETVVQLP